MERVSDVSLSAQSTITAHEIRIKYSVSNGSGGDVYVLDGLPARRPETRMPYVPAGAYSLFLGEPDDAIILVGVPPLPRNKLVSVRVMPLATKLPPGATLAQELAPITTPLTETSPYATDDELRNPEVVTVRRLVLAVQFVPAATEGLVVEAVDYDTRHVALHAPQLLAGVKELRFVVHQNDTTLRIVPRPR